jgi:hypothetical protein
MPEITFFKVYAALDMTREQSTTKRAVGGQEEATMETEARTNIRW